jgi:hypothetical protein
METLLCPLAAALRRGRDDDEKSRLYGGNGAGAVVGTIAILILVCFVLSLVGMVKAFGCGSAPTSLGLTGTGWGALILVMVLLLPPIGSLLGLAFALTGKCLPELVRTR